MKSNAWAPEVAARRARLFRETPAQIIERWTLSLAWMLKPERIAALPSLGTMCLSHLLRPERPLPDPARSVNHMGLCGIAHELSQDTLLVAYRQGLFPYGHCGPVKWISPAERCVLFFQDYHIAKRLRRQIRQGRYRVTFDRDFEGVIVACAGRREGRWHLTWITPRIMRAYAELFDAGHVHSFEVWNDKNELAGGGYGVAIGNAFFTESQFSHEPNTSKIGFSVLNWHLSHWGFCVNDGKFPTPTIDSMGFKNIPRVEFRTVLATATAQPGKPGRWQTEADLAAVAAWNADKKSPD